MGLPTLDLARYDDSVMSKAVESSNGNDKKNDPEDDLLAKFFERATAHVSEISFGGAVGFCSGYAVKQVGKVAAATIGMIFILAQVASSQGYIHINWKKVEQDVIRAVDPNGDGKITKDDFVIWWNKFLRVVRHNLPSSSGFGVGFLLGISCS